MACSPDHRVSSLSSIRSSNGTPKTIPPSFPLPTGSASVHFSAGFGHHSSVPGECSSAESADAQSFAVSMSKGTDANISRLVIFIEISSLRARAPNRDRSVVPSILAEDEPCMIYENCKFRSRCLIPETKGLCLTFLRIRPTMHPRNWACVAPELMEQEHERETQPGLLPLALSAPICAASIS